jgi:hypothetical protein
VQCCMLVAPSSMCCRVEAEWLVEMWLFQNVALSTLLDRQELTSRWLLLCWCCHFHGLPLMLRLKILVFSAFFLLRTPHDARGGALIDFDHLAQLEKNEMLQMTSRKSHEDPVGSNLLSLTQVTQTTTTSFESTPHHDTG